MFRRVLSSTGTKALASNGRFGNARFGVLGMTFFSTGQPSIFSAQAYSSDATTPHSLNHRSLRLYSTMKENGPANNTAEHILAKAETLSKEKAPKPALVVATYFDYFNTCYAIESLIDPQAVKDCCDVIFDWLSPSGVYAHYCDELIKAAHQNKQHSQTTLLYLQNAYREAGFNFPDIESVPRSYSERAKP